MTDEFVVAYSPQLFVLKGRKVFLCVLNVVFLSTLRVAAILNYTYLLVEGRLPEEVLIVKG